MEISKRKFILAMTLVFIIATVNGYAIQNVYFNRPHTPRVSANVYVTIQTEFGVFDIATHNVITNIGEAYVRDILGFNNVANNNATQWITLSNDVYDAAANVTAIMLPTEATTFGAGRVLGTVDAWVSGGDYAYNVTNKFTFTGDITLRCTGLQWSGVASSNNNLFACAGFTQTAFANNWNLTITWSIVWNANN